MARRMSPAQSHHCSLTLPPPPPRTPRLLPGPDPPCIYEAQRRPLSRLPSHPSSTPTKARRQEATAIAPGRWANCVVGAGSHPSDPYHTSHAGHVTPRPGGHARGSLSHGHMHSPPRHLHCYSDTRRILDLHLPTRTDSRCRALSGLTPLCPLRAQTNKDPADRLPSRAAGEEGEGRAQSRGRTRRVRSSRRRKPRSTKPPGRGRDRVRRA